MDEKINTKNEPDAFSPHYWEVDKHFLVEDDICARYSTKP